MEAHSPPPDPRARISPRRLLHGHAHWFSPWGSSSHRFSTIRFSPWSLGDQLVGRPSLGLAARGHDRNESGYPVNCCAELRFALLQCLFRPLALCQIEHECKALVASFFEQSGANKHRDTATVFPNILLLEGLSYPG